MEPLLFYVEGPGTKTDAAVCHAVVEELLAQERDWHLATPQFVNEPDEDDAPEGGWTVGLLSGLPPGSDPEAERRDLEVLVAAVSAAAREHDLVFAVQFRSEAIGFFDGTAQDARFIADFFGDS